MECEEDEDNRMRLDTLALTYKREVDGLTYKNGGVMEKMGLCKRCL